MQYPGRCVCELLDGVRFFYGVELSSSLCTICGARDPSPPIGYVHANTIPTKGLRTALVTEKKRGKRGKVIELFGKDEPGPPMFFSPSRIAAIMTRQQQLEAQKEQERLVKEADKERKAIEKEQKAQDVRERKATRLQVTAQKREAKQCEKEARICQK